MIAVTKENLPEGASEALRNWIQNKSFATLIRVIESKEKTHSAAVANKAVEAKDYSMKLAESNEELRLAQKYAIAIEVLKEIQEQKEPFSIVKLT